MKFLILGLFTCWSLFTFAAECDYHFSLSNATIQIEDSAQVVQQNFSVNRGQNSPDGRCKLYRIFFSKGLANSYQRKAFTVLGTSLDYNLHQSINQAGTLKEFADAVASNEFIEGSAPDKFTNYSNRFFVAAPGQNNNIILAGTYVDVVQVSLYGYNENSGNYLFEETNNLTVLFLVAKKVQLSLIDEGGAFDASSTTKALDFGLMTQNQEKGVDLRVLSNGSYQLKLSSLNNGKMVLGTESVQYALKVNGVNVSLSNSSGTPVAIGSGSNTSQAGDLYNMKVKINENVANKGAGLYQDVITITAIAN